MRVAVILLCIAAWAGLAAAQTGHRLGIAATDAAMKRWPDSRLLAASGRRGAALGRLPAGMDTTWYETADGRYYRYVKASVDAALAPLGPLAVCQTRACSPENGLLSNQVLRLYQVTQEARYYQAATVLMRHLAPRLGDGPVDFYAAAPFVAAFASIFCEPQVLPDLTRQLVPMDRRLREADASRAAISPDVARYMAALVSVLPYQPRQNRGRAQVLAILASTATEAARYPNPGASSLSSKSQKQLLVSASAASLVYAPAKAARPGYLPQRYALSASRVWQGLGTGSGSSSDPAATGAYLLAASEMQVQPNAALSRGMEVTVDAWYNGQTRTKAAGQNVLFHYKLNDYSDPGFSLFGHIFRTYGLRTATLDSAPTSAKLRGTHFYLIASPDNKQTNPAPHFMDAKGAQQIEAGGRSGGHLLLMENDPANADTPHPDTLADAFGLHFKNLLTHHVVGADCRMGRIEIPHAQPPFTHSHLLCVKDTRSLSLSKGATALLRYKGNTLMAVAHYGKGPVFAAGDPRPYNE